MGRSPSLIALLLASGPAFASPLVPASGGTPERVVFGAETDAARRISGGTPLVAEAKGPGTLLVKLFLELPRRGGVSGSVSAAVLLDGRPQKQLLLRRRRAQRGKLSSPGRVPSIPAAFSLEVPAGSHTLDLRLPSGTDGGAVLDFQAVLLPPVPLVEAAPRTVEAFAPPRAQPAVAEGTAAEAGATAVAAEPKRKTFRLAARMGAVIPSSELSVGAAGGADLSWILPIGRGTPALDQKLRLALGVGDSMLYEQGQKILPGRGLDPSFAEYDQVQPIDLSLVYTLPLGWRSVDVYLGAGYALNLVETQFQSFGRSSQTSAAASGVLFQLGVEVALGPGAVVIEARQSIVEADLGNLGTVGTDTLSGTTLGLGYAYYF
ncbi:MAG: hypothetical protein ACYDCL_02465 [Myxococcales bacterium]